MKTEKAVLLSTTPKGGLSTLREGGLAGTSFFQGWIRILFALSNYQLDYEKE